MNYNNILYFKSTGNLNIFFLTFRLFLTLVSKSDADVSETSVWLGHWRIYPNKLSGTRSLFMYIIKHNTLVNLFDLLFFQFRTTE